jgi:hypothetical protein
MQTDGFSANGRRDHGVGPLDARDQIQYEVLRRRHLARGGVGCNTAITAAAANQVIPLVNAERDALYGVCVTPNWGTTIYVTAKTTAQFQVNFGTVAPANAKIDWHVFRV